MRFRHGRRCVLTDLEGRRVVVVEDREDTFSRMISNVHCRTLKMGHQWAEYRHCFSCAVLVNTFAINNSYRAYQTKVMNGDHEDRS